MDEKDDVFKAKKDLSEYYVESISQSLDFIHELQYQLNDSPEKIVYINQELQKIFIYIYSKLKRSKFLSEIKLQWKINYRLEKIKPTRREIKMDRSSGDRYVATIKTKEYSYYKKLCNIREIRIYECLDLLGLLSKDHKETRRLR